eukprot:CAMPEP_0119017328 /NCGR_PEP_ID=MMETSP1176-20130426/16196_1 /TAXON_ID=265551 /ORGANISM="Synedropsis recta cf, Strain CCMP1620" /LENGTH=273 /DNA_ID=CAMNT_0006971019 /DNA_START=14 /DNA_END=835 /DNA_ORIENTATION=+
MTKKRKTWPKKGGLLLTIITTIAAAAAALLVMRPSSLSSMLLASSSSITSSSSSSSSLLSSYDPKNCTNMVNGHCRDVDGGAWSYRREDGNCLYREGTAPTDGKARDALPIVLFDVKSVLDFGGGVGAYLTAFRQKGGVSPLVIVEPQPLGNCLWTGLTQDTTDWINTPLQNLPKDQYDLVMTVEVVEHIPVDHHRHLVQALAQATTKWLYFSAAHPNQPGEGHVGPSMKTRTQWIEEVHNWTSLRVDQETSDLMYAQSGGLLRANSVLFRKP